MIYGMTQWVADNLAARKFPIRVEYGPKQTLREPGHTVIVVDRDRGASETVTAAPGTRQNPKKVLARRLPCRALVFAASTVEGANVHDHEHECDRFVDGLLTSLDEWATRAAAEVAFTGARFATTADGVAAAELETWPGVVYLVTFTVGRGVVARDYTGAGQPEGAVAGAGMRGTINVRRNGAEPPEIVTIG